MIFSIKIFRAFTLGVALYKRSVRSFLLSNDEDRGNRGGLLFRTLHYGPEKKHHLIYHLPTSEGVSKLRKRANE